MAIKSLLLKEDEITDANLKDVRSLTDFDLRMLLSEINDHGWHVAIRTLPLMVISSDLEIKRKNHQ